MTLDAFLFACFAATYTIAVAIENAPARCTLTSCDVCARALAVRR